MSTALTPVSALPRNAPVTLYLLGFPPRRRNRYFPREQDRANLPAITIPRSWFTPSGPAYSLRHHVP